MEKYFDIIEKSRSNFIGLIEGLSIEQVNKIPAGFNNNIIWNFAHTLATQQVICYRLAELEPVVDANFIDLFKKGTKPEQFIDGEKLQYIKKLSAATLEKLKLDFDDKVFSNFKPYQTSYNVTLNNIEDAIKFISVHDGLHLGYAMAQRKLVS